MAENMDAMQELQNYFNELKKHSVTYKLGKSQPTSGDELPNPLHEQFTLVLTKIDELLDKENKESEEYLKIISMKASIIYEKAKILLAENLLADSQTLLEEALELIKNHSEHPKMAFLHMRIINHLTYVLSRQGYLKEAQDFLLKTMDDALQCSPEVYSTDDLFLNTQKDAQQSESKLSRLCVNNMQMLAWIYARMGESQKTLKVQHDILQKQMDIGEGDVLQWAESCFRLAGMFVSNQDWKNAIYHLTAAESVLNPLEVALIPNTEVYAAQAELARTWVHFGLHLFEESRKSKISKDVEEPKAEDSSDVAETPNYIFNGLTVELPENVPNSLIQTVEEARKHFAHMQRWIKRARLFYTLRDYPLQYVNLCLDLSELYRYVALYEDDIDAEYAVQKRRYDALETLSAVLKEVRPNCYFAVNVELIKELIEVQMELMNLNLKKLYTPPQVPTTSANNDTLKRQFNAFYSFNNSLQKIGSTLRGTNIQGIEITDVKSLVNKENEEK